MRKWQLRALLFVAVVSLTSLGFFLGHSQARAQTRQEPRYVETIPREWGTLKGVVLRSDNVYLYFEDINGTIREYTANYGVNTEFRRK